MRRAFAENIGVKESFPREVCILEEACLLFSHNKIQEHELAAAAVRQALSSVPDAMSSPVIVTDIKKPNRELCKDVDTKLLSVTKRTEEALPLLRVLGAIQESHAEVSAVEWELAPGTHDALALATVLSCRALSLSCGLAPQLPKLLLSLSCLGASALASSLVTHVNATRAHFSASAPRPVVCALQAPPAPSYEADLNTPFLVSSILFAP